MRKPLTSVGYPQLDERRMRAKEAHYLYRVKVADYVNFKDLEARESSYEKIGCSERAGTTCNVECSESGGGL